MIYIYVSLGWASTVKHMVDEMFCVERRDLEHLGKLMFSLEQEALEHMSARV